MCTSDAWRHRDSMEPELATSCISQIDQVGRITATGFDNEPWRHISNIVITSMFLLVAFGAPRSQALPSAVNPVREASSMASGGNALHGWQCPFDCFCVDGNSCGPG